LAPVLGGFLSLLAIFFVFGQSNPLDTSGFLWYYLAWFVPCEIILGNGEMAKKLPVIIDNRNDNTLLEALCKLLPGLKQMYVATSIFEVGLVLLLFWR